MFVTWACISLINLCFEKKNKYKLRISVWGCPFSLFNDCLYINETQQLGTYDRRCSLINGERLNTAAKRRVRMLIQKYLQVHTIHPVRHRVQLLSSIRNHWWGTNTHCLQLAPITPHWAKAGWANSLNELQSTFPAIKK